MDVNLMVLSPRMPLCNALFARHAELIETNTWAVVDIAVTGIFDQGRASGANTWINAAKPAACRMEPSGCLIEDMNNGYCKVRCSAWNVQTHPLMMPLL
jgi:homeobox-leucine zipper protein